MLSSMKRLGISETLLKECGLLRISDQGNGAYAFFRDRILFPITDRRGRVIGFGGRLMGDGKTAKYINSPDTELFNKVETLSNHGRSKNNKKQFWSECIGYKYKMSNIQAAIGLAQLERINDLVNEKRKIFNTYKEILRELPLEMNTETKITTNGFWMPNIVINEGINFKLDNLIKSLNNIGADARNFFWPLSTMNVGGRKVFNFDYVSEEIHLRALNLPSPFGITEEEIKSICSCVINNFK